MLSLQILLAMTAVLPHILVVIAMWIRHADFGPALRRLKSMIFRQGIRKGNKLFMVNIPNVTVPYKVICIIQYVNTIIC